MKHTIQVHIYKGDKYFVAECNDLSIVTQGKTYDELIYNINEAIELHLESEDFEQYDLAKNPSIIANIELGTISA